MDPSSISLSGINLVSHAVPTPDNLPAARSIGALLLYVSDLYSCVVETDDFTWKSALDAAISGQ
jgi:hypothetical protein